MPGMMRWNCSRDCCLRDNRAADKRQWMRDADVQYVLRRSAIPDILETLEIGFGDG